MLPQSPSSPRPACAMRTRQPQLRAGLVCSAAAGVRGVSLLSPICEVTAVPDVPLLGKGRCVDGAEATAWAFACTTGNASCASAVSVDACATACVADPGCTGFELGHSFSSAGNRTPVVACAIFVAAAPALPGNWTAVAGAQQPGGRVVVSANATLGPTSCCYKRSCVVDGCGRTRLLRE